MMRLRQIALALMIGGGCLAFGLSAIASRGAHSSAPLSTQEIRPYLEVFLDAVGEEMPKDAEYARLTRLGAGAVFIDALGKRPLTETHLKSRSGLRYAFTVLSLEFAGLIREHSLIPAPALDYRPKKAPRSPAGIARLNYARLARAWYALGHDPSADYPQEFFSELREAGFGVAYPEPDKVLGRYDYAARLLHILLFESDAELMSRAGPEIVAASLDLFGEMNAVVGDASSAMRILRQLVLDSSETQAKEQE